MKLFNKSCYYIISSLLLLNNQTVFAQKSKWKKLSKPEKHWVIKHPFIAYKTFKTTQFVINTLKDKSLIYELDSFDNGGKLDAFRHIYWMACLTKKIGIKKALSLGNAHEKGNYIQYLNGHLEDGLLPDYASSKMDSLNNLIGANHGSLCRKAKKSINQKEVISFINNGNAYILNRNNNGHFVDCNGVEIDFTNTKKKEWVNNKCVLLLINLKK